MQPDAANPDAANPDAANPDAANPDAVHTRVAPVRWVGSAQSGHLAMLDQRRLPAAETWLEMSTYTEVADGIREMVIRGAPAIGIAAAFGVALASRQRGHDLDEVYAHLAETRPTAVNLGWALARMRQTVAAAADIDRSDLVETLVDEARAIMAQDRANNLQMGRLGADLLPDDARVLTHCNTGGLATGGYGTALGIIRAAHASGSLERVWVDETRPYLQGARLTTWECIKDDIPATLITDNMAGHFMQRGQVDAVVVGTDRVAANGDVANKIGTYALAVLCAFHDIPFYVAAPVSTIDPQTPSGDQIPIEERSDREVTDVAGQPIAPSGVEVAHPAFDVTPHALVSAIITEDGVIEAPYEANLGAIQR